jgi:hypothetical protein
MPSAKSRAKPSPGPVVTVKDAPAKTGRPTDYRPEYVEQVRKVCALGATHEEIAEFFDVTRKTIYTWRIAHP